MRVAQFFLERVGVVDVQHLCIRVLQNDDSLRSRYSAKAALARPTIPKPAVAAVAGLKRELAAYAFFA
jgi:hypothetical protein